MPGEIDRNVELQIGHILFLDIVGYSKLASNEQRRQLELLNQIVRGTDPFRAAEAADKLIRLPTGDGMALVFFTNPDAPVRCAAAISRELKKYAELKIRMGVHSGPVDVVHDVNDRPNVTGAGINMAQRVMDCADAGHILLSKRAADDLAQYDEWKPQLHDLGEMEVKHGVRVPIVNFYNDGIGNSSAPTKLIQAEEASRAAMNAEARRKRRRMVIGLTTAAVLVLLAAIGTWAWHRRVALASAYKAGLTPTLEKSIAVLPFKNLSEDKENAYLAEGVQDDILTDLTKVADLKVISRRSVAQYRDTEQSIREIGKALQVAHVLEGSVRKVANQIHVTAQLIDTRDERQTWAEKYDRDIADVFQIQNDISQAIVSQLKAALSPTEKAAINEKPTQNKEAYDLYLRAHALVYGQAASVTYKTGEDNTAKAITLLESAITRDPKFTLAYCALADARLFLEEPDKAKAAVDAAIRISPNSPEAHVVLARYLSAVKEEVSVIEKELGLAAAGLPGRVDVFVLRAEVEERRGQWKEALHDREKAAELDPQNLDSQNDLIFLNIMLRRYDIAEQLIDRTIATAPQQSTGLFWRRKCDIALARGDTKAAMTALDSSPNRTAGLSNFNHLLAHVLTMKRDYAKAEEIVQSAEETAKTRNTLPKLFERNQIFRRGVQLEKLGRIARFGGEEEKARKYFEAARPAFEEWLAKDPTSIAHDSWQESHSSAYIAEIDAALGRKEDAIRELRDILQLWPLQRDTRIAPNLHIILAVAYLWASDRDAALQQLMGVAKVPVVPGGEIPFFQGLSAGELKLNPIWDELRSDPRFDKVVAEAAKPVKL